MRAGWHPGNRTPRSSWHTCDTPARCGSTDHPLRRSPDWLQPRRPRSDGAPARRHPVPRGPSPRPRRCDTFHDRHRPGRGMLAHEVRAAAQAGTLGSEPRRTAHRAWPGSPRRPAWPAPTRVTATIAAAGHLPCIPAGRILRMVIPSQESEAERQPRIAGTPRSHEASRPRGVNESDDLGLSAGERLVDQAVVSGT